MHMMDRNRCTAVWLFATAAALSLTYPCAAQVVRRAVPVNPVNPAAARAPKLAVGAHATAEEVEQAIQRAQAYLLTQQQADGSFERQPAVAVGAARPVVVAQGGQVAGLSALATYALLTSGLPSSEPHVAKALDYLRNTETDGTYALGLRCQVWYQLSLELDPNETRPSPARRELERLVERDANLLLNGINKQGQASGMYTYHVSKLTGAFDHSCSNYGAMGVWACAQVGARIPQSYWATVDQGWKSHQIAGEGWAYTASANSRATPSMTAGGLVNLFICQEFLDRNVAADCHGNPESANIETAIQWLGQNPPPQGIGGHHGYTLFNLARVGFESGYVQFVDYDWYTVNADNLVRMQSATGQWADLQETAFDLAFLSLGRAPVVMNKLQYGDPAGHAKFGHWNQRPRDVANITRWIEKQLHKRLNWQVVNLSMPMEVMQQSPILYIAGNQALKFTPEEIEKLKHYILAGGMIVANADCGSKEFAASIRQLGEGMFPDYAFRSLPARHAILSEELFPAKDEKKIAAVDALGNQAREFILLIPNDDAARAWQVLPQVMQAHTGVIPKEELYHLAGNLYYYSTERGQVRDKKKTWILPEQPKGAQKLTVARLEYDGNWNPEPFGWESQFANYLRAKRRLELESPRIRLGSDLLDTAKFKLAYLTGTGKFELTDKQREDLKRFTYEGGVVIVDAAGGSPEFVESAQRELKQAFGQDLELVPATDPLYSIAEQITAVKYREKAQKIFGKEMTQPVLKMIQEDGKVKVLFSPLDIAVGLVGQAIDSVNGYEPESAMQLMMNMLLYGLAVR
jgi:hypothetical protein